MRDFVTALEFLTRVRLSKRTEWHPDDFSRSVAWFPFVGLLGGVLMGVANWYLTKWLVPDFLRAVLLLVWELFIFGGLMYDGYMDTCDGVYSARDRERMLEIMKDSHVGANAVLGVGVLMLLKVAIFATFTGFALSFALPLSYVLTRSMMAFYIVFYPNPRGNGIGKMFKDYAKKWYAFVGLVVLAPMLYYTDIISGVVVLITFVVMNFWAYCLTKTLGGLTGDTYGFLTEVGGVVFLLSTLLVRIVL